MTDMPSTSPSEPRYPYPGNLPRPWNILGPALVACGIVLLALHSPLGFVVAGVPLIGYFGVIMRRAGAMREAALISLEASASTMDQDEVERHLAIILRIYGGGRLSSVKERVARIRERTR